MEQVFKKENHEKNITKKNNGRSGASRKRNKNNIVAAFLCFILGIIVGILISNLLYDKDGIDNLENSSDIETEQQTEQATSSLDDLLKEEGFVIETPFVNLHYPENWKDQTRVEQVEGDVYTIQFYAAMEGKEEIHIFDIVLGGEEGFTLGYMEAEDGVQTSVNVVSYEINFGEAWTDEEKNIVYTMSEDVNYMIGMLQQESGFIPAS